MYDWHIFSQIKIDLPGYVPLTLQTFMVCVIASIAPCKADNAFTCLLLFICVMGAVGLPVFAGFHGGMGSLVGYSRWDIFLPFLSWLYVISNSSKHRVRYWFGLYF